LRPEIVGFDADALGLDFAMPMIFLQGELDACTVSSEVEAYAARIRAPQVRFVSIPEGGHSPWVMRERFLDALVTYVRPTLRATPGAGAQSAR
jgi:pimeloyl-ACP methyl ester carboxylesterase